MNWLTKRRPSENRNILRPRDAGGNLWIKCPDSGQLVFYKDVEANQFVIPGSNYHMRMGAVARPQIDLSTTRTHGSTWRCPRSPPIP